METGGGDRAGIRTDLKREEVLTSVLLGVRCRGRLGVEGSPPEVGLGTEGN